MATSTSGVVGAGSYGSCGTNIADSLTWRCPAATTRSGPTPLAGLNNGTEYRFRVRGRLTAVGGGAQSTERRSATPMAGYARRAHESEAHGGRRAGDCCRWTAPSDNGGESITRYEYLHREESRPSATPADWTSHRRHAADSDCLRRRRRHDFHQREDLLFQGASGEPTWVVVAANCDAACDGWLRLTSPVEVSAKPFGKPVTEVYLDYARRPTRMVGSS